MSVAKTTLYLYSEDNPVRLLLLVSEQDTYQGYTIQACAVYVIYMCMYGGTCARIWRQNFLYYLIQISTCVLISVTAN